MISKRVVFERTSGPRKGIFEIAGIIEYGRGVQLPSYIQGVGEHGASLITVKARYAVYREIWMSPRSQFGDHTTYDPRQV